MTLENKLRTKLGERYALDHSPPNVVQHEGWTVSLRPEAQDALSAQLWDVTLQRDPVCQPGKADLQNGDPRAWAERISRKATGLLEPLKLVEVDAGQQVALLRSAEPTPKDPGVDYHEIELHGTHQA